MTHIHPVHDNDKAFIINPATREIVNASQKTKLVQEDHNSERFTFELPRHVDGHDMLTCNKVKVHYNNISASTKEQNSDVYTVDDVRVSPDSDDVVIFSWLISGNATMYAGVLAFLISFECTTGETIDYAWHTGIYSDITVGEGMNNGEASIQEYTDVLARWQAEIDRLAPCALMGLEQTQKSTESGGVNVWTATFGDGRQEQLEVKNGVDGKTCFVRYSHYPDGADFSETFGEHEYIGFATGLTAPTDKSGYTWSKFRTTTVNTATSLVFDTEDAMNAWIESKTEKVPDPDAVYKGLTLQEGYTIIYSVDNIPDSNEEIAGASLSADISLNYLDRDTSAVFERNGRYFCYHVVSYPTSVSVFGGSIYEPGTNITYSTNERWTYSSQTLDEDSIPDELLEPEEKVIDIEIGTNFYVLGDEVSNRYVWDGAMARRLIETAAGLTDGAVTTDKIASKAVTKAKLAGDVKREFEYEETIATDITDTLTITNEAKLPQNGIVVTGQENSQCTEPFDVVEGEKYLISGSYGFAFVLVGEYDASNNFIGYIGKSEEETVAVTDYEYTVPTGVSKIIVSNSSTFLTPNLKVKKVEPATLKTKVSQIEKRVDELEEDSLGLFNVVNAFSIGDKAEWSVTGGVITIDGHTMHIEKTDDSVGLIELERLNIPLVEKSGKKVFFYFEERAYPDLSYGFNGGIKFSANGTKTITAGKVNRDYNAYYGVFDLTNDGAPSQRVSFLVSASNMIGVENSYDIRNIFISDSIQGFDTDFTEKLYLSILSKNGFFEGAQPLISAEDYLNLLVSFERDNATLTTEKTVTVGESGDFKTLNGALKHLSRYYPAYKQGGVNCQIKILSGTIISEQVTIQRLDLSYITIIAEDAQVPVDASEFTIVDSLNLDAHDLRGDVPFIGGENAAKLPVIGCLFKLTVQPTNNSGVVGYFANRGSTGVVLADSGFDGFNDGVIANNESSITIRQGIARNCTRWGVHARHNGEVSARSCDLSNSGEIAAYADRVANLDAREANVNGSKMAFAAYNSSVLNGNMDSAIDSCGDGADAVVHSKSGSTINVCNTPFSNSYATLIKVEEGGVVSATGISVSGSAEGVETYSQPVNTLTAQGVIFG